MMASNILSRLLPSASDEQHIPSQRRASDRYSDTESHAGMAVDEENLRERFQDQDLEDLLAEAAGSEMESPSTAMLGGNQSKPPAKERSRSRPKWAQRSPNAIAPIEEDDDVPESLLLEGGKRKLVRKEKPLDRLPPKPSDESPIPAHGPSTQATRAQWEATRTQQRLHSGMGRTPLQGLASTRRRNGAFIVDPRERAMWKWANVENLDRFLRDVYVYYAEHGIWSIVLYRTLRQLSLLFIVSFVTFLTFCIDYSALPNSTKLEDVRIKKCTRNLPVLWNFSIWIGAAYWIYSLISNILDMPRLWDLHNFYTHLLDIPDRDIQTVTWQYVVGRLMALRDANFATAQTVAAETRRHLNGQSKQRMDAHDIANRLMRMENYWIAIVNRDILDCTINIPFVGKRQFFTKVIEWNLGLALMDYVFDEQLQLRPQFMTSKYRRQLVNTLKRRFFLVGVLNIITALPMATYYVINEFFTTFTEYQKNPAELGARNFSRFAEWKFRDFNEVPHMFDRRSKIAQPYAARYLDQFPKDKTTQLFKFTALVSGALAAVLGVVSLLDPELFLGFEIAGRTVLFWLGVMTPVYMAARAATPDDEMILDPEFALLNVIECTHYHPASWSGRLHSDEVRAEFSSLYKLKIMLYLEELASVILAPVVFMVSLPRCAEQLIDFFREFTIHVEGLGHVCSFAVFDFTRQGEAGPRNSGAPQSKSTGKGASGRGAGTAADLREDYYAARDNKIRVSMHSFLDNYADNPKRGLHGRNSNRRHQHFHLPPVFPGLAASGALAQVPELYSAGMHAHMGIRGPAALRQSYLHTPRLGPVGEVDDASRDRRNQSTLSPMHSVLLDPHHQPRPYPGRNPRSGGSTQPHDRHDAAEANDSPKHEGGEPEDDSSDSNLGDSWALRGAASGGAGKRGNAGEGAATAGGEEGDKGVGVLGLLYQLQKVQAEGRGTKGL